MTTMTQFDQQVEALVVGKGKNQCKNLSIIRQKNCVFFVCFMLYLYISFGRRPKLTTLTVGIRIFALKIFNFFHFSL